MWLYDLTGEKMFHQEIKYGKLFHCLARKMFKIIIIIKPRNLKLKVAYYSFSKT